MNHLLRPRIWPSFLASSGVPSRGSGEAPPAMYHSGTPRDQSRSTAGRLPCCAPIFFALAALRSVPQAGSQFRGLATAIHEISGLGRISRDEKSYLVGIDGSLVDRMYQRKCTAETR